MALQAKASAFAEDLRDAIEDAQKDGIATLAGLAGRPNELEVPTRRGCEWTPTAMRRVLQKPNCEATRHGFRPPITAER